MSDHAAFLAAVSASPDDDLPRLVYADWLDETGDPADAARAEFIRLQCELERTPADDDRRAGLERREKTLLKKHAAGWTAEAMAAQIGADWKFRRGFLHSVTVVAQRFGSVAETLFRVTPTVRAVRLCQGSGAVDSLIDAPQLAQVSDLDLSRMCTCGRCPILAELRKLFASERVGGLTRLTLADDRIDPVTAAALVSSPHLTKLSALDLSGNAVGLHGTRVLAAARGFGGLRELNLSENGITPYGGRVLASAAWLMGLRVLNLSRNRLGDTGGRALLKAEFGDGFERLDLQTNDIQPEVKKSLRAKFGAKVRV